MAIEDILAVQPTIDDAEVPEQQKLANVKQFVVFYAKRMVRTSNPNKWRQCSQTFQNSDSQVCRQWIQAIQQQLDGECPAPFGARVGTGVVR